MDRLINYRETIKKILTDYNNLANRSGKKKYETWWYSIDLTALKQLSVSDPFSEEGRLMDKIKEITTDIDVYMTAIESKRKEV